MKYILNYCMLMLFLSMNGSAQGTDVIIWIDNSSSVNATEYPQMRNSVQAIITSVLQCNPLNRVAVAQYSANQTWIETNFTNNAGLATTFGRRFNAGGYAHRSLGAIGNALDGVFNADLVGVTNLTPTPGNALAVFFFTDAARNGDLCNMGFGVGAPQAFLNYTAFKTARNATFIVVAVPADAVSRAASAAIASVGGTYTTPIENYPGDPDGAGVGPRLLWDMSAQIPVTFQLNALQIQAVTQAICAVANPPCPPTLTLTQPGNNVGSGSQDNRQAQTLITASNILTNGAVGIYHAGQSVVLTNGFRAAAGSRFRGYIEGCTGNYVGRSSDEAGNLENPSLEPKPELTVFPNPTQGRLGIKVSDMTIRDVAISRLTDSRIVLKRKIALETDVDLDISHLEKGIYILSVQTSNGEIFTQKLIKN